MNRTFIDLLGECVFHTLEDNTRAECKLLGPDSHLHEGPFTLPWQCVYKGFKVRPDYIYTPFMVILHWQSDIKRP